jgi:hypothetical protein
MDSLSVAGMLLEGADRKSGLEGQKGKSSRDGRFFCVFFHFR